MIQMTHGCFSPAPNFLENFIDFSLMPIINFLLSLFPISIAEFFLIPVILITMFVLLIGFLFIYLIFNKIFVFFLLKPIENSINLNKNINKKLNTINELSITLDNQSKKNKNN